MKSRTSLGKAAKAIECVSEMTAKHKVRLPTLCDSAALPKSQSTMAIGGGTMKLISDEEQIREIEFMQLQEQFAENEIKWRRKADYKAAERASAAEEKLAKMFMDGWADRETMAKCYNQYRLRLLYKHKPEA